jgi:small subunit ribosomal protein S6
MTLYELMFAYNGELTKDEVEKELEKFKEIIEKGNGELLKIDDLGVKKFAYPIKKKNSGYYFLAYLKAEYSLVKEINRIFKINENLFRYMFVKLDPKKFEQNSE